MGSLSQIWGDTTTRRIGRRFSSISEDLNCRVGYQAATTSKGAHGLADYFTKVLEDDLKAVVKPQYVDQIPKALKGADRTVETLLKARSQMDNLEKIKDVLGRPCNLVWF